MNNKRHLVKTFCALILAIILPLMIPACSGEQAYDDYRARMTEINGIFSQCQGKGLTRKELAGRLALFDDVEEKYGGKDLSKGYFAPHFILESPENYEATENTRYDIEVLDKDKDGFIKGIKVTPYEIDVHAETDATNTSEETAAETTKAAMSTDQFSKQLDGWWKTEDGSKTNNFIVWFESLESQGMVVTYSIVDDGNSLKVLITTGSDEITIENNYGFIFTFIDADHVNVTGTGETDKTSTVYERCDAPE